MSSSLEELIREAFGDVRVSFVSVGAGPQGDYMASVKRVPSLGFSCSYDRDPAVALRQALETPPAVVDPKLALEAAKQAAFTAGRLTHVPAAPAPLDDGLFG